MKIKRFNNINEQLETKSYHFFAVFYEDAQIPDFYIFEDDNDAFNFLANYIYKIYNENELDISILDECADAVELIEQYEEDVHENHNIDKQVIFYTTTSLSSNIELDDWIKLKRLAKKYNV